MLSSRTNAGVVLLLVTAQVFAGVVLFETRRGLAGVRVELAENTHQACLCTSTSAARPPLDLHAASGSALIRVESCSPGTEASVARAAGHMSACVGDADDVA
jgi:hypothetical protein